MTIFSLRLIAMVSMLIDHIAAVFLVDSPYYIFCRMIGRLAFPIFAFLLVEGYKHTSNWFRYLWRLFVVALVSQVPYMVLWPQVYQVNVCFLLEIGVVVLLLLEKYRSMDGFPGWLVFVLFLMVSVIMKSEYGLFGIFLILSMYAWWYGSGKFRVLLPIVFSVACSINYLGAGLLALPLIALYRGEQGRRLPRWLVYGFYPVHLCILALLYI